MFLYDLHVHTAEGSLCGRSPAREMVRAYAEKGYAGMVVTDHFIHGNTAVPRDLPWEERMQRYYDAYLAAREEGERIGFDVIFGIEHKYTLQGHKEALVYGVQLETLKAHPEIETQPFEVFCRLMHADGAFISLAHPYRKRDYIPDFSVGVGIDLSLPDGIEVYNACNIGDENLLALYFAHRHNLRMTSGGDIHNAADERIGLAGMAFPHRIRDGAALTKALFAGEGELLLGGRLASELK